MRLLHRTTAEVMRLTIPHEKAAQLGPVVWLPLKSHGMAARPGLMKQLLNKVLAYGCRLVLMEWMQDLVLHMV
jgi:hypothetical protein